jgi:dTDP-4-amino-4,6-dideoxygalactose transaminase
MRPKLRKALHNPYKIVKMFEEEIADYTGAPYAISVDSCTNALFLCCKYLQVKEVIIPSKMNLFKVKKLAPNFRIYKLLFLDCTQKFRQIYNLF